jgi:HD-GYP domain-containing protein (c-di-GMP phosphodiesterase class II)
MDGLDAASHHDPVGGEQAQVGVRLAEVVSCLSLATGLCTGQPIEHGLRRGLLAVWLGEELDLGDADLSDAYYVALLGSVGCTVEGTLFAKYAKDDIGLAAKTAGLDPTKPLEAWAFGLRNFGAGEPPLRRAGKVLSAALSGGPAEFQAVCRDVALRIGDMLDIGPTIQQSIAQCHETWDGKGGPKGLMAEEINLAARIFHVAANAEILSRLGGVEAAIASMRRQSGGYYDPVVVERFCDVAQSLYRRLEEEQPWDAVLSAEPAPLRWLSEDEVDTFGRTIANFVDLRSPFTLGHSTGVATLAERTGRGIGLSDGEAVALRHAGYLHDLGRIGVPAGFWNTATPWTTQERERANQHPSLTELVLARSTALGHLGTLAGLHHERLDGSGYRGVPGSFLPVAARILAATDTYHTKIEPRPHRTALAPDAAAEEIRRQATRGQLDSEVTRALLDAAGHEDPPELPDELAAGLSEREVEVLRLIVRGLSNRQMAKILFISPKTVGHHVEHIYDKVGVSTRVGATLFALQHDLVREAP